MKKLLVVLAISMASFFTVSNASAQGYKQGDNLLNVGIGVNSYYSGGIPIGASLEFGVTDKISVGPSVDFLSHTYSYGAGYSDKFTAIYFGGRASYHFNELLQIKQDNVDVYGGVDIGYRSFSWSDNYGGNSLSGSYGSGLYLGLHIGGKYYFAPKVGVFAELGATGSTNVRIGVGFKL